MYEMADQSWRDRPRRMSIETAEQTAARIGEHAHSHGLTDLTLILHGGEPLLAVQELIWRLVTATRKDSGPDVRVNVHVQTNAVGLTESCLRLFSGLLCTIDLHNDPVETYE